MQVSSLLPERPVPRQLVLSSAALAGVVVAELALRLAVGTSDASRPIVFSGEFAVGVVTAVPFLAALAYAGYWLAASDVPAARHGRVWWWAVSATAASLLLNAMLIAVTSVESTLLLVAWLRWAVAVGAGIGVGIGLTEARTIQKAREAERSEVRAQQLESQRDLLDYLHSLLRHEVLNASNVISGYASTLREEQDEGTPAYEYTGVIQRKSEEITSVIDDIRVLLQTTDGHSVLESVDVVDVVEAEAEKLTDLDESASVEVRAPESAFVPANALLPRVFGNLLANAVVHNDSETPRVTVNVTAGTEAVTVDVVDNGPGIPAAERDGLFERPSKRTAEHGLGLYIVGKLVRVYGGSVELIDTGPVGSTFRVVLPRTSPTADEVPASERVPSPFEATGESPRSAPEAGPSVDADAVDTDQTAGATGERDAESSRQQRQD